MATQLKKTVKPSGGDYTSLETCMNANEQNLVTADKYFDVEIDGTWSSADTTSCTIHNYTTDATRYINIYTTETARHNGTESAGYTLGDATGYREYNLSIGEEYVSVTGIIVKVALATSGDRNAVFIGTIAATSSVNISNCVLYSNGTVGSYGIYIYSQHGNVTIWNCIIDDFSEDGINLNYYNNDLTLKLYNNTVYGCTNGINLYRGTTAVVAKNNLCNGNGIDYTTNDNDFAASSTHNLSEDATAPALGTYYRSKAVLFATEGSDFHLSASDTEAINKGVSDPGSGLFSDDIDGDTRGASWDIGADEYVAAGGISVPVVMWHLRQQGIS